jgi:hypothetical protein
MKLFPVKVWDWSIEIVNSRILLDLFKVNFIITNWRLRHLHNIFILVTRILWLRGLFFWGFLFLNSEIILPIQFNVSQATMRFRMFIILKYFIGDVTTHFGVHCNLSKCFLQLFIHGRIIWCLIINLTKYKILLDKL